MVGCTFGAIGCLGVVVFLIYFCVQKNSQERSRVGPLDRGHHRGAGSTLGGPSGPDFKHVLKPPPYTLDPPPAYTENPPHASAPSFYKNDFEYTTANARTYPLTTENSERMRIPSGDSDNVHESVTELPSSTPRSTR